MPWMWGDGYMWGTWGLWGWLLMPLMMALVWVPLLLLVGWGARLVLGVGAGATSAGSAHPPAPEADARELARRGYARGDMTRERFLEVIADLDQTEGPRP